MNKNIFYIRSTSIINDSRASKEINSLINNNYNLTIIGWDRDKRIKDYNNVILNDNNIKCIFFKYSSTYGGSIKNIIGLLLFQIWLFCILCKNHKKIDYIHACDFDCGYISMIVCKLLKKEIVYDMYDYYSDSRPMPKVIKNIIDNLENKIINYASASIICGDWRKEQIKKAKPNKLYVIHNTPDIKNINKKKIIKTTNNKIKIGYIGILQENRLIMEIINELKGNEDYELHIGGFGIYANEIENISKKYKNIYYYGSLIYNDVLSLEKDCDILFATYDPNIPNHKYSAPNKIYEAMSLGKPIIVCKNTGIDKLIIENKLGYAIDYSSKEFKKTLKNIKSQDLKDISKNAKKLYNEKYNWKKMEEVLIDIYKYIGGSK